MDFLDFVSGVVQQQANKIEKKTGDLIEQVEKQKIIYDSYDDKELIEIYNNSSGKKKVAAAMCLKERGYGKK